MATSYIFKDPSINLHISPFNLYVLSERSGNFKNREILKKIEKRKTITGNIFSVRAVNKDLVVGGDSRKVLKDALGNANLLAEILNPGNESPEYLFTKIEFNPKDIVKTSNQIRLFIKELCQKDIEYLRKDNHFNLLPAKNDLIEQLEALDEYLTKEIYKSGCSPTLLKKSKESKKAPKSSNFRNGLPGYSPEFISFKYIHEVAEPSHYEVESETEDGKVIFSKSEVIRAMGELGWDYDRLIERIKRNKVNPIINTKDITLRFKSKISNSRYPGLEFEVNKDKRIEIKIGTKAGCIFYGAILFSMYEGNKFKRSDLTDVANSVKKKYKESGSLIFSEEDYASIPLLNWFEGIYKAVLGNNRGTFVHWCIEEYNSPGLNIAVTLIKDNIEEALDNDDFSDLKELLLIQKRALHKGSPKQTYWIELPIDQVELPDEQWGDLKKEFNKTKTNSSLKNSHRE